MAISRIFLWFGVALIFYAALMLIVAVSGFYLGEIRAAQIFIIITCLTCVLGLIVSFTTQNAPKREGARDILIFLFIFWVFVPVVTGLPYLALNLVPNWTVAYFESVSAITTTGASTLVPEDIPRSILLWRSLLQWSGGCFVATFAVVILVALNFSGTGVHRSVFFTLREGDIFSRLLSIGGLIATLYAIISVLCAFLLIASGTPVFEALCLGLSAVSTGALTPRSGVLASYVSNIGSIVLALTCLLGAFNISMFWDVLRRRNFSALGGFLGNIEHRGLYIMISLLFVFGVLITDRMHIHTLIVEAAYWVTTAGFDYHVIGIDMLPSSVLIAVVLIGGSALSTAGGIKMIRFLMLMRHLQTDLDRMSHPSRVIPVRFEGQTVKDQSFLSIWMYFFAYTLVFALGSIALGASGVEFTEAISASASALSNTGPLLEMTNPNANYAGYDPLTLNLLTVIMLLGRIEILAAFAVLSPSLWVK